jgi:hypothetical protein
MPQNWLLRQRSVVIPDYETGPVPFNNNKPYFILDINFISLADPGLAPYLKTFIMTPYEFAIFNLKPWQYNIALDEGLLRQPEPANIYLPIPIESAVLDPETNDPRTSVAMEIITLELISST